MDKSVARGWGRPHKTQQSASLPHHHYSLLITYHWVSLSPHRRASTPPLLHCLTLPFPPLLLQHWCLYPAGGLQAAKEWAEGSEEEGEEEDAAAAGWAPALPSSEANLVAAESGEIAAHAGAHAGSSGAGSVVVAADQLALPRGSPGRGGGGAATP